MWSKSINQDVKALGAPGHGVDGGVAVVHVDLAVHACRPGTIRPHAAALEPHASHRCAPAGGQTSRRWTLATSPPDSLPRCGQAYPVCPGRGSDVQEVDAGDQPPGLPPQVRPSLPCVPRGQEHL